MQALGPENPGRNASGRSAGRGFVGALPAPARRLARRLGVFLERREAGGPSGLPLGRGAALACGFFAASVLYATVVSGSFGVATSRAAASLGLGLGDVSIDGAVETRPETIYAAIGLDVRPSLVGLDLSAARERLLVLPWIRTARLRTVYPGGLSVEVEEREAFAVWQADERLTVVERTGRPITAFGIEDLLKDRFAGLPKVVGEGAAEHASDLLPLAARHARLAERVRAYVRVADRRWNMVFDNGLTLKLPEYGIADALVRFAAMEAEHEILARPIEVADMRDPSRMALKLAAAPAKERADAVAKHLKAMKAAEPRRGQKRL